MILVAGATGILGGEICRRLSAAGKPMRALVRQTSDAGKIDRLKSFAAALVNGDLRDRASLDAACKGVSAVIATATTTISRQPGDSIEATDQAGLLNLVDAANAAGRKFEVIKVPVEALQAQRDAATDSLSKSFAGLMLVMAEGDIIDMRSTSKSFPVPLGSVKAYAERATSAVRAG